MNFRMLLRRPLLRGALLGSLLALGIAPRAQHPTDGYAPEPKPGKDEAMPQKATLATQFMLGYYYTDQRFDDYLAQVRQIDFVNSGLSPEWQDYYTTYVVGRCHWRIGEYQKASDELLRFAAVHPTSPYAWRAHYVAAESYQRARDWPHFYPLAREFPVRFSDAPDMYKERMVNNVGYALEQDKGPAVALAEYERIRDAKILTQSRETWTRQRILELKVKIARAAKHGSINAAELDQLKQTPEYKELELLRQELQAKLKTEEDPMIRYQYEKQWIGTYFISEEFGQMEALCAKLISEKQQHDKAWGFDLLYLGIAKTRLQTPDLKGALQCFEAVMRDPILEDEEGDWSRRGDAAIWATYALEGATPVDRKRVSEYIINELPRDVYQRQAAAAVQGTVR